MKPPPSSWQECANVLRSDDLDEMMQVRLVDLAFNAGNPAVSVRAIEMLLAMPRVRAGDDLAGYDVDMLLKAEQRAIVFLDQVKHGS